MKGGVLRVASGPEAARRRRRLHVEMQQRGAFGRLNEEDCKTLRLPFRIAEMKGKSLIKVRIGGFQNNLELISLERDR
jgi:hypothetical protein